MKQLLVYRQTAGSLSARFLLFLCIYFLAAAPCFAKSALHLKSGEKIEGDVIERTDDYVKINLEGVELTYWSDQIGKLELDSKDSLSLAKKQKPAEGAPLSPSENEAADKVSQVSPSQISSEEPVIPQKTSVQETVTVVEDTVTDNAGKIIPGGSSISIEKQEVTAGNSVIGDSLDTPTKSSAGVDPLVQQMASAGYQPKMTREQAQAALAAMVTVVMVLSIVFYLFFSLCLQFIAIKTNTSNAWLAWIPIANFYLMCKVAKKPIWWLLCFFVPILNIIIMILLWAGIAEARNKPSWLGVLMLLPVVNLFIPAYLAFSK